jgi:hypothetical protein
MEFPPHVTAPGDRRPAGLVVHQSALTPGAVRIHWGIAVTSPARTLLDCAPAPSSKQLSRAVNDARHSGHMTLGQLAEVCERSRNRPDRRLLFSFVNAPSGPTRSEFEDAFLAFCQRYGLPRPLVNRRICGHRADAFLRDEGVIVELDGVQFHDDRGALEADRDRDAEMLAAGLVTVRITRERLTQRPGCEAKRRLAILTQRRSRLPRERLVLMAQYAPRRPPDGANLGRCRGGLTSAELTHSLSST